jgi:sirohydrochlorin ferrochelatase
MRVSPSSARAFRRLAAALPWRDAQVTLFEADSYFGGHAHTVDVTLDGVTHGVDTGFLVFNERTYPQLIRLFAELGVDTAAIGHVVLGAGARTPTGVERQQPRTPCSPSAATWCRRASGHAGRDRCASTSCATGLAERNAEAALAEPIGDFLDRATASATPSATGTSCR